MTTDILVNENRPIAYSATMLGPTSLNMIQREKAEISLATANTRTAILHEHLELEEPVFSGALFCNSTVIPSTNFSSFVEIFC